MVGDFLKRGESGSEPQTVSIVWQIQEYPTSKVIGDGLELQHVKESAQVALVVATALHHSPATVRLVKTAKECHDALS